MQCSPPSALSGGGFLDAAARAALRDTTHLQSVLACLSGGARLWVVTEAAAAVASTDRLGSLAAPLWTVVRRALAESPSLWATLIDVEATKVSDR